MNQTDNLPNWTTHGGRGPHLLLVHGFLSSRAQWLLNLDSLAEICRPVTVELLGHASSPSPAEPAAYAPAQYVRCFEEIRRAVGAERWFLLGYSLGAGLTIRYALEHPDRVLGHLFTNSTSALADANLIAQWRANAAATAARIREQGQSALRRIPVHPRHARRLPTAVREPLLADAARHDPAGIAYTLTETNPQASVRELVTHNQRPALLLFGERERRFHAHKDHVVRHMPKLEVATLDAGHGLNMESPQAFNRAVADFISRCPTS